MRMSDWSSDVCASDLEERARQATELQTRFDAAIMEREAARRELAALQSQSSERERSFGEQLQNLQGAKEQLSAQFSELAQKILVDAQGQFLKRADERFHQAGEKSEAQLKALLQPFKSQLTQSPEVLHRVEKASVDNHDGQRAAVEQVWVG